MPSKKSILFSTVFLSLIPLSAAQSGNQFFTLFSGYVGMPVTNGQQFIMYVLAPFLFVFAISRFIAKGALMNAMESSGLGGEVGKRAPTLIGVATAGIMMILFGGVLLWLIVIFAILGAGWFLLGSTKYAADSTGVTGGLKKGASAVSDRMGSGSSSSGDSSGVTAEKVSDMLDDRIDQLKSELSSIDDEEQDEKQKEDQTEQEEEEGQNPDQVEDEIESEEAELMDIVKKLETVEEQLNGLESDIDSIEELELDEVQRDMSKLNDVESVEQQVNEDLQDMIQRAKAGRVDEEVLEEFASNMAEWEDYLRELRHDMAHEHNIHQSVDKILEDLREMRDVLDFAESDIHKAETLVNELEDEEQKAEALSQKYGAREIFEEIEQDESETSDIESEIRNKVVERYQELQQGIEDEIERAEELKEYDEQEFDEILDIVQGLDQEEGALSNLRNRFSNGPHEEYEQELEDIIEHIEEIESMARQLSSEHQA
ncbi:hypothetical protein GKQ38_05150 [Candidatus Nanohaloarchaea archaeon]|nr:hypothetical protein GKQ38_05150 [Candidatus Nanohaloarchaea archaeon]